MKLLLVGIIITVAIVQSPWPLNTEFEIAEPQGECRWWDNRNNVHIDCPQEVRPPVHWTAWWLNQVPYSQPEMFLTDHEPRVKSGTYAVQYFSFWRRHNAGLYQQFRTPKAAQYRASIWAHSWYSNCSTKPYDPPLDYDCTTPIDWAHMTFRIGIEPWHSPQPDPREQTIVWGEWQECYVDWCELVSPWVYVTEDATVWLQSTATHPLKHVDGHFDEFHLEQHP